MARPRIVFNMAGFAEVRSLPTVTAILAQEAQNRATRAGPGYETRGPEVSRGRGRGRAAGSTGTAAARRAEARNHNLGRA